MPNSCHQQGQQYALVTNNLIIQDQPTCSFHPCEVLSIEDNDDNFEDLLEKQQSTAGFEIVAGSNIFIIKHRVYEKDAYTKVSKYDIFDGNQQCLFICNKEYNSKCFRLNTAIISAYTDVYKDPIFVTTSYFLTEKFCTKVTGINGITIGVIYKCYQSDDYTIQNEYEDSALNVICNSSNGIMDEFSSFDVWDGTICVANLSRTNKNEISISTIGSLTSVNKILLLGFTFYIDGIYRGDNNSGIYSFIGL